MRLVGWSLGISSLLTLIMSNYYATPVIAQCVQADISLQYNISGSVEPTERSNDVDFQSDGGCQGNASVTTGVQGNIGGNSRVRQTRKVRHRFVNIDGQGDHLENTVQLQSNPAIDVYNAADNLNY